MNNFFGKLSFQPSEVERVLQNIREAENLIQQKQLELGQLFYLENKDKTGLADKYQIIMDDIMKIDENRKGYLTQKLRLEGNMQCVNCGEIIPLGSVYCSFCGKNTTQKEEMNE